MNFVRSMQKSGTVRRRQEAPVPVFDVVGLCPVPTNYWHRFALCFGCRYSAHTSRLICVCVADRANMQWENETASSVTVCGSFADLNVARMWSILDTVVRRIELNKALPTFALPAWLYWVRCKFEVCVQISLVKCWRWAMHGSYNLRNMNMNMNILCRLYGALYQVVYALRHVCWNVSFLIWLVKSKRVDGLELTDVADGSSFS